MNRFSAVLALPLLLTACRRAPVGADAGRFDPYKKVPNYHELNRSRPPPAITIRDGRILFMNHCAGCHGGDGRGLTGKGKPRVPDFSAGAVQDKLQDAAIMRAVSSGHAGSPSYAGLLDDGQGRAVVQFMRELRL